MVAEISGTGLSQTVVGQQSGVALVQRATGSVRPDEAAIPALGFTGSEKTTRATQVTGAFAQLKVRQDDLNKSASVVREVSVGLEKAGKLLDKAEGKLGEIVKMYPPYPIDSPQRVSLLNDLSGLRKQIAALAFPPPSQVDSAGQLLGAKPDPASPQEDSASSVDAVNEVAERLWDVPVLDPSTATDEQVSSALGQVRTLNASLRDIQTGMWRDVVSFLKQADSPESKSEAVDIRDRLAELGSLGIGNTGYQLVQAAESE